MAALGLGGLGVRTTYDYAGNVENNSVKKTKQNGVAESGDSPVNSTNPNLKQESSDQIARIIKEKLESYKLSEKEISKAYPDKNMTDEGWKKFMESIDKAVVLYKEEVKQETENAIKNVEKEKEESKQAQEEEEQSKTDTELIVKADGSRVLMVTVDMGGIKSTMSIEIAKPTEVSEVTDADKIEKPQGCSDISAGEVLTGDVIRS